AEGIAHARLPPGLGAGCTMGTLAASSRASPAQHNFLRASASIVAYSQTPASSSNGIGSERYAHRTTAPSSQTTAAVVGLTEIPLRADSRNGQRGTAHIVQNHRL